MMHVYALCALRIEHEAWPAQVFTVFEKVLVVQYKSTNGVRADGKRFRSPSLDLFCFAYLAQGTVHT